MARLEIAVTTLEDALRSQEGGADSIEICQNLTLGGLTPEFQVVESILKAVTLDVHVIVRPHAKSFHYASDDEAIILRDSKRLADLGVKSIVFGAWNTQSRLDLGLIERVQHTAIPVPLTIHRALDQSIEPEQSLEVLLNMGIHRVLTSGPAANAWDGRTGLAQWMTRFGTRISFVASGGLTLAHLPELTAQVGAPEYHFGAAARTGNAIEPEKVRQLRAALPQ